jgi:hypothetical protein
MIAARRQRLRWWMDTRIIIIGRVGTATTMRMLRGKE